jgi:tRNA dimethylallyltransferase
LLVIAGPTATGKTGLSLGIAEALIADGVPVEIISADSRQIYRGLDIGTAKVGAAERARVRHHGIDLVDPDAAFTVVDFAAHADDALASIATASGVAILVGGTGLYLRAVARGLARADLPHDPAVRAGIEADLNQDGLAALAERLAVTAPTLAAATDLSNPRRVVRALELATLRGDGPRPALEGYGGAVCWIGLDLADRGRHRAWIETRARAQFAAGLVEEARALRERWDPGLPAFSAIGYREAWAVLDDALSIDEAIAADAQRNVAFARRQRTWFRGDPDITRLDPTADGLLPAALALARPLARGR